MARPVIAFLTDFGTRDHYVAAMKGVALGICPEAALVDITHEIEPQDVAGGALELAACYRYFPAGTVFVAVVDPGVGSARRAIAREAEGYRFVGPDNGLLSLVGGAERGRAVEMTSGRFALATISRTFEGRDRFAPAAAWLAGGSGLAELGPAIDDWQQLELPQPRIAGATITGEIVRVDRFGNLVSNVERAAVEQFAGTVSVSIAGVGIGAPVATYAAVAAGRLCALYGSSERLEIAVNGGSAASQLGAGKGTVVRVQRIGAGESGQGE